MTVPPGRPRGPRRRRCAAAPPRREWLDLVLATAEAAAVAIRGRVTVLLPDGGRVVLERRPPASTEPG